MNDAQFSPAPAGAPRVVSVGSEPSAGGGRRGVRIAASRGLPLEAVAAPDHPGGSGGYRVEVSLPTGETWAEHAPRLVLAFHDAPTVTA